MAKDRAGKKSREKSRTRTAGGLVRETVYLYEDESDRLEAMAEQERCSKSEIVRRALRRMFKEVE